MAQPIAWMQREWVVGAGFMAAALLAVTPALWQAGALPLVTLLIYLHGPAYMIHQVEEHAHDRFRRFANQVLFGGVEALSPLGVLVVNLPFVWGINLAALCAAVWIGPEWGLAAPWLILVNALTHLGAAIRLRRGNPGLVTALILFAPLGVATLVLAGPVGWTPHLVGLGVAVLLHLAIVAVVLGRARILSRRAARAA